MTKQLKTIEREREKLSSEVHFKKDERIVKRVNNSQSFYHIQETMFGVNLNVKNKREQKGEIAKEIH